MQPDNYDLNHYQPQSRRFANYPAMGDNMVYPALKLCGEAGEIAELRGKHIRKNNRHIVSRYGAEGSWQFDNQELYEQVNEKLLAELGDVLWYVAAMASEMGLTLNEVAFWNIEKLTKRKNEGTLTSLSRNKED